MEEDFRVRAHQRQQQQQHVRFLNEHPAGHRRFEQVPPDEREFEYSPRFVRPGFVPNRGGEPRPGFDHPPIVDVPDEVAMGVEVGYHGDRYREDQYMVNRGKRKMLDVGPEGQDYDFREDHFVGSVGKRRNFNGGSFQNDEWNTMKRPVQKASAFGRIQSGVSVWSRIEEKPASPYVDLDDLGFLEENQPDVENLDLSYKSNGLVAKVVAPSSSSPTPPPESVGNGLKVVRPKDRVKGKKVDNDREKVVVSVGSSVAIPGVTSPNPPPELVGKGLKVVRPKDRVKMMKVDKDREKVVVLLGSSAAIPGVGSQTPPPELMGKGLKVVTLKDRVKKKKVDNDRERVVVSVGSNVAIPGVAKGAADPKKPKGKSPLKDPNNSEGSEKIVRSSSKPLQGTSCSEESKMVVTAPCKPSSGSIPQSSSKRRAIASSSEKTEVGASTKPVSKKESSPNLVSNELDGLEKTIDFKREIAFSGNIANGASSEPLPRKESNPLQDSNHSEGSVIIGAFLSELASGVGLQDSKVVSPSREIGSSTQLLSRKQNSPLQGFSPLIGSEKIIAPSSKSLSSASCAFLGPAIDVGNLKTENTPLDFNSSLGSEKILVSSSKPSTGSNLKSSSKRTIAASRKPATGASTEPLFIVDSNPVHFSNEAKGSEKLADSSSKPSSSQKSSKMVIASSGKDASGASSKNSKRAIKVSPAKKRAAKRDAKTIFKVENHVNEDSGQEAKASKGKLTDVLNSQLCQPGTIVVMESIKDSAAEQNDVNLVQGVGIEDTREEESSIPNEKIDQNSCYPLVSDSTVAGDPNFEPFAQEVTTIRTSSQCIGSIGNGIIEDPSKGLRLAADDVSNLAQSNTGIGLSSFDEFSSFASVGNAAVIRSVVTESSTSEHGTFNLSNMKRKREILEEQQILEIPAVSEELETLAQRMPKDDVLLPSEVSSLVLAQSSLNYAGQEEYGPSLVGSDGLRPSDSTATPDEILPIPTNDLMAEIKEQPSPLHLAHFNTSVDVSTFQDALNFMDTIRSNSKLSESNCSSDNDGSNNQDENPTNKSSKAGETMQSHEPVFDKTQLLSSHEYKEEITTDAKLAEGKSFNTKTILSFGVPSIFQNQINSSGSSKGTALKNPNVRSKTWHRSDASPSASQSCGNLQYGIGSYKGAQKKQSPKKLGRVVNSSYVRKGNSLVRKSTNEVLPPRPPHALGASSRSSYHLTERSISLGYTSNNPNHTTANPSFERPKTPPLPSGSKLPNCSMDPLKDSSQPMSEDPIPETGTEAQGMKLENQALDLVSASLCKQSIPSSISSESLTRKRMIYVKHKSNQLVAAPQPAIGNVSSNPTEKAQKSSSSTSSDLYYKRKKNQLILNALSSDSQQKQDVDNVNFDDQGASKVSSCNMTGLFKKRLDKVLRKTKHSKSSRVWTLHGGQQGKKGFTAANLSKVTPYLFPWKRTTYCQISSNKQSLSLIRSLQFTRRRDTIYKVSNNGFSLQKTGVVSIGGASLKWSKSIEKHSKKANEEATLAVAEVERRKRERERSTSIHSRKKNKNSLPRKSTFGIQLKRGERIFRVGSVRYKMDSSKRTLVRIPDESPTSVGQQSAKNTFVPRRLLIGNDEYIRKGSGNQLVRDPKKLIRILASEKVRWSLHTVRSRLAKKQQYCQFFTRFGKCNKSSGKCPYMHDPAKVAICTKFLRGVCSDSN